MDSVAQQQARRPVAARVRGAGARTLGWFRHAPASLGLLVTIWLLALVTGSVLHGPSQQLMREIALGVRPVSHGRWWVTLTSGLWASSLPVYLIVSALIVAVAVPIERRMGTARFAVAALATQLSATVLALGSASIARMLDDSWGFRLHIGLAVGPTVWLIGVVVVATHSMGVLWRRRIRVGLAAFTVVEALFGGQIIDLARVWAVFAGLVLGAVILPSRRGVTRIAGTRRESRVLVAIVVGAAAIGPVVAALSPHAVGPFAVLRDIVRASAVSPAEVREMCADDAGDPACRWGMLSLRLRGLGPTLLSILPSIGVLVLADGLRRGRRFAWWATVGAQVILLALSLLNYLARYFTVTESSTLFYGLDDPNLYRTLIPFLTPAAVLVLLLATRSSFDVSAPRGTYRRFFARVVGLFVGLGALFVGGGLLDRRGFDPAASVAELVRQYPQRLVPPVYLQWFEPTVLPVNPLATVLFEWTGVVFWVGLAGLAALTFVTRSVPGGDDAVRARAILESTNGTDLSWMTTWRGNSYWFGPDGRSFVAYRVIGGVALTTGDPVGPPERVRASVEHFAEFAAANGWSPCFYSISSATRAATRELGWDAMQVAEETVLDLGELAFTGKRFQDVRTALNRAKKEGVTAQWARFPTASVSVREQIIAISEEWVAEKGMPEMGFTLGGLDELDDEQVRLLIAIDEHGVVHGVTSWLPVYRDGSIAGWTLDFMRRRSDGFKPAMEFLIASAALKLEEEGYRFVSLSGAPLAKVAAPTDDSGESRATEAEEASRFSELMDSLLDLLGRTLEPVYGFRSLLAFKAKFFPRYEPMYMAFPDPAALPSIGSAVGRAYLGEVSVGQSLRLVHTMIGRGHRR